MQADDGLPAMHPAAMGVHGFFFFGGDDIFALAFTDSPVPLVKIENANGEHAVRASAAEEEAKGSDDEK